MGSHDYEDEEHKSKIHRVGCQERQAGALGHRPKLLSTVKISSSSKKPPFCWSGL
jgi:hypothetical protein